VEQILQLWAAACSSKAAAAYSSMAAAACSSTVAAACSSMAAAVCSSMAAAACSFMAAAACSSMAGSGCHYGQAVGVINHGGPFHHRLLGELRSWNLCHVSTCRQGCLLWGNSSKLLLGFFP